MKRPSQAWRRRGVTVCIFETSSTRARKPTAQTMWEDRPATKEPMTFIERLLTAFIDTSAIRTVCCALGPYRNLTTLTASILALHPDCRVLNHGGKKVFNDPHVDFLTNPSRRGLDLFVRYALFLSRRRRRGGSGGSITASHAFERSAMRQAYVSRYGKNRNKRRPVCLFWKESQMLTNVLRRCDTDLGALLERHEPLRFLMPVRNPLDCAHSNMKTGHVSHLPSVDGSSSFDQVLGAILEELRWFLDLRKRYPDRFFCYFQNAFDTTLLQTLAAFLCLPADRQWMTAVEEAYSVKSPYRHAPARMATYQGLVDKLFAPYPEEQRALRGFIAP